MKKDRRDELAREAEQHLVNATGRWSATSPMWIASASEEEMKKLGMNEEQIEEAKQAAKRISMQELERRAKETP